MMHICDRGRSSLKALHCRRLLPMLSTPPLSRMAGLQSGRLRFPEKEVNSKEFRGFESLPYSEARSSSP